MKQKYMIIWDLNFRINEVYDARYKLYKNEKKSLEFENRILSKLKNMFNYVFSLKW